MRTAVREPQLAEQLVEVPTILSYSSLQRTVEQNVDIPVPHRGERIAGLRGFLPRQRSTALQASQERTSERIVEQNVAFPIGGGLQDFLPGQTSSASSSSPAGVHGSADGPGEGVFRTFPHIKKKRDVGLALGVGTAPRVEPIHTCCSCGHLGRWRRGLDPHRLRAWALLEEVAVRPRSVAAAVGTALIATWWLRGCWCGSLLVAERQERSWLVRSSPGLPSYTVAWSSRWCRLCTGAACQSWRLLEEFPVLRCCLVAVFALGNLDISTLPSYLSVLDLVYGCCLWNTAYWIFRDACATWFDSGYMFWIHVLRGPWKN